jgi:hypothetical protein
MGVEGIFETFSLSDAGADNNWLLQPILAYVISTEIICMSATIDILITGISLGGQYLGGEHGLTLNIHCSIDL